MREVIMRLTTKPFEAAAYAEIVQELVRCEDCKFCENTRFFNTSAKVCRWWEKLTDDDGFCHAAKRRGEEG